MKDFNDKEAEMPNLEALRLFKNLRAVPFAAASLIPALESVGG